jgi:hypothetical protein
VDWRMDALGLNTKTAILQMDAASRLHESLGHVLVSMRRLQLPCHYLDPIGNLLVCRKNVAVADSPTKICYAVASPGTSADTGARAAWCAQGTRRGLEESCVSVS